MQPSNSTLDFEQADLRRLIAHSTTIQASASLEEAYREFSKHTFEFMAVLDGQTLTGLCSRAGIGMLLGSRYGFSLFSREPVRAHLLPEFTRVRVGTRISQGA